MTKDERLIIPDAEMGGDSACWAHLFDDAGAPGLVTNLAGIAMAVEGRGPVWTQQTDDLNVNLLVFHADQGVDEHVNTEVDVLMIGIAGEGVVSIDGTPHALPPGHVVIRRRSHSRRRERHVEPCGSGRTTIPSSTEPTGAPPAGW